MSGPDLSPKGLAASASWIRDVYDPIIAREGPNIMDPDDALTLHQLFKALQENIPSLTNIRVTRIHFAILDVAGVATRWPAKLIDECDIIIEIWQAKLGSLKLIPPPLYGPGGRLWRICDVSDQSRDALLQRFNNDNLVLNERALRPGALGFEPGQWWISALFAYRDGIINDTAVDGGICADQDGAYAIILTDRDEVNTATSTSFTYRCRDDDKGRWRLTTGDFRSKMAVRVLRSHNLLSIWSPRVGIRYDGLYKVAGWRYYPSTRDEQGMTVLRCEITLDREPGQKSMDEVMRHPLAHDVDDYNEFHRQRRLQREARHVDTPKPKENQRSSPTVRQSADESIPQTRSLVATPRSERIFHHPGTPVPIPEEIRSSYFSWFPDYSAGDTQSEETDRAAHAETSPVSRKSTTKKGKEKATVSPQRTFASESTGAPPGTDRKLGKTVVGLKPLKLPTTKLAYRRNYDGSAEEYLNYNESERHNGESAESYLARSDDGFPTIPREAFEVEEAVADKIGGSGDSKHNIELANNEDDLVERLREIQSLELQPPHAPLLENLSAPDFFRKIDWNSRPPTEELQSYDGSDDHSMQIRDPINSNDYYVPHLSPFAENEIEYINWDAHPPRTLGQLNSDAYEQSLSAVPRSNIVNDVGPTDPITDFGRESFRDVRWDPQEESSSIPWDEIARRNISMSKSTFAAHSHDAGVPRTVQAYFHKNQSISMSKWTKTFWEAEQAYLPSTDDERHNLRLLKGDILPVFGKQSDQYEEALDTLNLSFPSHFRIDSAGLSLEFATPDDPLAMIPPFDGTGLDLAVERPSAPRTSSADAIREQILQDIFKAKKLTWAELPPRQQTTDDLLNASSAQGPSEIEGIFSETPYVLPSHSASFTDPEQEAMAQEDYPEAPYIPLPSSDSDSDTDASYDRAPYAPTPRAASIPYGVDETDGSNGQSSSSGHSEDNNDGEGDDHNDGSDDHNDGGDDHGDGGDDDPGYGGGDEGSDHGSSGDNEGGINWDDVWRDEPPREETSETNTEEGSTETAIRDSPVAGPSTEPPEAGPSTFADTGNATGPSITVDPPAADNGGTSTPDSGVVPHAPDVTTTAPSPSAPGTPLSGISPKSPGTPVSGGSLRAPNSYHSLRAQDSGSSLRAPRSYHSLRAQGSRKSLLSNFHAAPPPTTTDTPSQPTSSGGPAINAERLREKLFQSLSDGEQPRDYSALRPRGSDDSPRPPAQGNSQGTSPLSLSRTESNEPPPTTTDTPNQLHHRMRVLSDSQQSARDVSPMRPLPPTVAGRAGSTGGSTGGNNDKSSRPSGSKSS